VDQQKKAGAISSKESKISTKQEHSYVARQNGNTRGSKTAEGTRESGNISISGTARCLTLKIRREGATLGNKTHRRGRHRVHKSTQAKEAPYMWRERGGKQMEKAKDLFRGGIKFKMRGAAASRVL